jgi:hypothetical protein
MTGGPGWACIKRRHDTQNGDIWHNDTQRNSKNVLCIK